MMLRCVKGCHDLSLAWPRTNSVQYSQPGGGPLHQLAVNGSTTMSQRRRPCSVSATDSTDGSPVRQTAAVSFHCSDAERRDLCDKYGIVDADLDFSTRQPDAGLPPVDLDLVDGVVDRMIADGGGRPPGEVLTVNRTPLFGDETTHSRCEKNDLDDVFSQPRHTATPWRVTFDDVSTGSSYRPACNCGTLPGTERSPYYFKLDEVDAVAVNTSITTDRSPLIAGRPVTSDKRHSDVIIGSDQFK